jgi:hypothetical protein
MCKSLPENNNRAPSEPFKNMTGTFTWERRYFGQSFSDGNDLLRSSTDILIWDLGNAIFGKSFKESVATYVSLPRGMPRRQPTGMFLGPLVLA